MILYRAKIFVFSLVFSLAFIPSIVLAQDQAPQTPLSYENVAMGIKIVGPTSWFANSGDKVQQAATKSVSEITNLESIKEAVKKAGVLVVFSEYQLGSPVEYNPSLVLVTEPIPVDYIKSPIDLANASLMNIRAMFKDVKIIVQPEASKIGTKDVAHFVYEGTIVRGYLEIRIKSSVYLFIKDNAGYTIACTDKVDHYSKNTNNFNAAVNSFIIK